MTLNWGWRITIVYTAFALATIGVVAFAMTQDVELVRSDYYEYGLKHDEQMKAEVNAQSLAVPLTITYDTQRATISVAFPPDQLADLHGTIQLYRTSSMKQDRTFEIHPNASGVQMIDVRSDARGKWIVKVNWTSHGTAYKVDQPIVE